MTSRLRPIGDFQVRGSRGKSFVERPQKRTFRQTRRSKQMDVHISYAAAEQFVALHQFENFFVRRNGGLAQQAKIGQYRIAPPKITQRDFADNERMRGYVAGIEENGQGIDAAVNMPRPN